MLLYLVKQVELAVRARLDELLRPDGLTALQYTALTVLERHPDMSVAQLARNSFVTAQSMADMVAALKTVASSDDTATRPTGAAWPSPCHKPATSSSTATGTRSTHWNLACSTAPPSPR